MKNYEKSKEDMKHDAGKGKGWEGSKEDEKGDKAIKAKAEKAVREKYAK